MAFIGVQMELCSAHGAVETYDQFNALLSFVVCVLFFLLVLTKVIEKTGREKERWNGLLPRKYLSLDIPVRLASYS